MSTLSFDDFDAYTSAVRDANVTMTLRNLVYPKWNVRHLDALGIHIQRGSQGSGDITEGCSPGDGILLYLPLRNENAQRANGTTLSSDSIVIVEPGSDFYLCSNIDHDWCTVFVPFQQLPGWPAESDSAKGQCRTIEVPRDVSQRYRTLLQQILTVFDDGDSQTPSVAMGAAVEVLAQMTSTFLQPRPKNDPPQNGRPTIPREEVLRRAKQVLDASPDESLHVGQLATACDVSERTLRSVFNEYLGVSPIRYLQMRRLQNIHRELVAAAPEGASVRDILLRNGEWEFGRFARRYRRTFGELPSETLRAKRP